MTALPGYLASVWITTTASVPFTNYNLVDSGTHLVFAAPVNDAKRYWDPAVPLVVQTSPDGVTWTTVTTGFTIQRVNGAVTFLVAITGGTPSCRILSGNYFPLSFVGDAKSVDVKVNVALADATAFTNPSTGWNTKVATLADTDISLSKWYIDITFMAYLGNRLVLVAYDGRNSNQRYECFAFMKSESIKIAEKDLVSDDLDFVSDGPLYFINS